MKRSLLTAVLGVGLAALPFCPSSGVGDGANEPLRRLYVSPAGDDAHDGLSPESAFRSIGQAARVVQPGDLVLVAGGTYVEHVKLERAGTPDRPIVFRAAPFETALVTFGDRPEGWQKVAGTRFCWSLRYAHLPNLVWEDRTAIRYVEVNDPLTLDKLPGSYLYDREQKVLNVHPLHGLTPDEAVIVVVRHSDYSFKRTTGKLHPTLTGFFSRTARLWDRGFLMCAPYNRVEGFTVAYQPMGIQITTNACQALNNTVYGCVVGIHILEGDGSLAAGNTCFRNNSHGILAQTYNDALISNNVCRANTPAGAFHGENTGGLGNPQELAFYGGSRAGHISFIGNRVVAQHPGRIWRIKGLSGRITATHNVFVGGSPLGHFMPGGEDYSHNTVVGGALVNRHSQARDPITPEQAKEGRIIANNLCLYSPDVAKRSGWWVAAREYKPDRYPFADPGRDDYRLRPDSPDLGTGACPDAAPVRYVAPAGDDGASGLTPKTAWRTLAKAAASARSGDTVYVLAGTYAESITLAGRGANGRPLAFKSYGRQPVVLDGGGRLDYGCILKGASQVIIDGLVFKGFRRAAVALANSRDIQLVENVFDGTETGVHIEGGQNIVLANNTCRRCGKGVAACGVGQNLVLRNNLFLDATQAPVALDEASAPRVLSERNAASGPGAQQWLARWQTTVREPHASRVADIALEPPHYRLPRGCTLAFEGLGHRPIGARDAEPEPSSVAVENLRAASLRPDAVVLAWDTPCDFPDVEIRWSTDDGKKGTIHVRQDSCLKQTAFATPLRDLTPGTTCRVRLTANVPDGRKGAAELTFRTPESVRAPGTLYVAPDGNDASDGTQRGRAFRTLSAASLAAVPGDRIRVAPGVYPETVRIWCGGLSAQQRLTFESEQTGGAIIDCEQLRPSAFVLDTVQHVTLDGFRIRGLIYARSTGILAQHAQDVIVRNISAGSANFQEAGHVLEAHRSRGFMITNNLFGTGWFHVKTQDCEEFTIAHNTFFHGGIGCLMLGGVKDASWRITDNIFLGRMHPTKDVAAVVVASSAKPCVCDRNLYWQYQPKRNGPALFGMHAGNGHGSRDNARTIEEAAQKYGMEHHGKYADPGFVRHEKGDFSLKPDSPAIGMGEDGTTAGSSLTRLIDE
ncbi:MAG: right-handed parallel beta-helix repeat-containing protein [Kiritimatiellae bacterium]|nr:right-handed parallel beta-helix repeat-containing protein [Kiritimatiellia bacterium]